MGADSRRCHEAGERAISIRSTRACDIVPRKEEAISDNGRAPVEDEVPVPLRERLWFIFVMMCIVPPYGLVLLHSAALKTMTIGFPTPLLYKRDLKLSVTVNEPNVAQIVANVIHGAA